MAWITPTLTSCKGRIPKEWPALSNAAKQQGEDADTISQEVIDSVVTAIRGRVPPAVRRGADGTIPDEMTSAFYALWVYEFIIKLPAMKSLLDDLRVKAWDAARADLTALSMGRINLVPPSVEAPANEQPSGTPVVIARPAQTVDDIRASGLL